LRAIALYYLSVLFFLLLAGVQAHAQQVGMQNQFMPDSSLRDSSRNLKEINRQVRRFSPYKTRSGLSPEGDSIYIIPVRNLLWDEADTLSGFVQSLGNTGKPVRRLRYGLPDHLFDPLHHRDAVIQTFDIYWLEADRDLRFYDTRTPFVNVNFAQASKRLQMLELTISQNVTPSWNALLNYRRRTSDGNFNNSAFDHYNIYTTHTIHSRNRRYELYAAGLFQQLKDGINGGINATNAFDFNEINPLTTPVNIEISLLRRQGKSIYLQQQYRISGGSDSSSFRTTVFTEFEAGNRFRQYEDMQVQRTGLHYPQILKDSFMMNEAWHTRRLKASAGIGFRYSYLYQEIRLSRDNQKVDLPIGTGLDNTRFIQNFTDITLPGHFIKKRFESNWVFRYRQLNYFKNGVWSEGNIAIPLPFKKSYFNEDTVYRIRPESFDTLRHWQALRITGNIKAGDVQGNLADSLIFLNTFRGTAINKNQGIIHGRAGLEWQAPDRIRKNKYRLSGNYAHLQIFHSQVQSPIIYTEDLQIIASGSGVSYFYSGIDLSFRLRLNRFYLEPGLIFQRNGFTDIIAIDYTLDQPAFYGKTSFYYENEWFGKAGLFRIGTDLSFFSDYNGFAFDPGSGLFYPSNQAVASVFNPPMYLRADVYITAKVKDAVIFIRMLHVNQGIQALQYYTTPYYPMWGRTFSFGVNWTFFD